MTTAFQPSAYSAFVSVLGKDSTTQQSITREQLLGGLAYYLTELPHTYVQAFVTITLCSPALWGSSPRTSPFDKIHPAAWGVMQATQQAVIAKHAALLANPDMSSILPPLGRQRVSMAFKEWIGLLVSGSQPRAGSRDCSVPRLAFLSGLVLGLRELRDKDVQIPEESFSRACVELVVSTAECLDQYAASAPTNAWDSRAALRIREAEPHVDVITELCAVSLPLIPDEQFEALDLSKLACVCFGTILHMFEDGHCFDLLESELTSLESGPLDFKISQPGSKLPQVLKGTHASSAYIHLGSTAKLVGHIFVCMSQSEFWQRKLYRTLDTCIGGLGEASLNMEKSWSQSSLCTADKDEKIAINARPTTTIIWHMLKSFLFTTVLIARSALDTVIYYNTTTPQEGKALSRSILTTLCRLSFVSLKFGALAAEGGGFSEMKRAFFGALDVLASNVDDRDSTGDQSCVKLVTDLSLELSDIESSVGVTHPIHQGRVVYFLVCAEHVMNQLTEKTIEQVILPIVQRHLADNDNREKYEAAHSVMLAIFAASETGSVASQRSSPFSRAHLLVPAYIDILLQILTYPMLPGQNSNEDKLSTDQFRLAFQALVRSAGSSNGELSWFCVEELKVAVDRLSGRGPSGPAVYHEIMERLGDREKDQALKWWMKIQNDIGNTH
ncbi:hypothetical protein FRC10_000147 [Ceratobasidium sp. 414]|nr:hypothetical protein FRC10_000147 [Ceratobasidium sp. 414]